MVIALAAVAALLFALGTVLQQRAAVRWPSGGPRSASRPAGRAEPGVKAALMGTATGILFGLSAALTKARWISSTAGSSTW